MAAPDDPRQFPWLRAKLVASWRETLIVLFVFNGYFISSAVGLGVDRLTGHAAAHSSSNASFLHVTAMEAVMLAAFFALLRHRGWEVADLRIDRDSRSHILGLGFAVLLLVLWRGYVGLLVADGLLVHHGRPPATSLPPHVDLFVILLRQVVNGYYEEILMMAYAFNQFATKVGPAAATILIVSVRVMGHLWKDPIFLPFTALHFLLTAALYCATRKIWPLILSHALYDIVADLPLAARL